MHGPCCIFCSDLIPFSCARQSSLEQRFAEVGGVARSIDARLAEATVPADRDQIFAAIERLDGGFDGLNRACAAWDYLALRCPPSSSYQSH